MARQPIDSTVAAAVLFASDRTCCVCRERGKPVQIHHIDEDHSNNDPDNLSALCFDCHHQTQLRGGFARQLDAAQVREYRADWLVRVARRRDEADRLATEVMVAAGATTNLQGSAHVTISARGTLESQSDTSELTKGVEVSIWDYVRTLPELRRRAYAAAQADWDSSVTAQMVQGSYRVIDVLQEVLVNLARRYPAGHFDTPDPKDYISELISTRFRWHRYHNEPDGQGKNGTIVHTIVAGEVLSDAERMVAEMVGSLTLDWSASTDHDFRSWSDDWNRATP